MTTPQPKPDTEYRHRQQEQLERYLDWARTQPDAIGSELPTQLSTLFAYTQKQRMNWLKEYAFGRILEVGCNFGAVLAWVEGDTGLDIAQANVELARLLSPDKTFDQGDAKALPYHNKTFATVMLPEVLEHLSYPDDVHLAIGEACRVATHRVLITMPDGQLDSREATSFKHQFLADADHVAEMVRMFPDRTQVTPDWGWGFVLIRADLK